MSFGEFKPSRARVPDGNRSLKIVGRAGRRFLKSPKDVGHGAGTILNSSEEPWRECPFDFRVKKGHSIGPDEFRRVPRRPGMVPEGFRSVQTRSGAVER
jgi:hypothetical protein